MTNISGKWSVSTNEENYHDIFDTKKEAIEEGLGYDGTFWVGQCIAPTQPDELFDGDSVENWLEHDVYGHEDYAGEWSEGHVSPTKEQREDLASHIRPVIAAWLDRHKLRPTFWNIDPLSVQEITAEETA